MNVVLEKYVQNKLQRSDYAGVVIKYATRLEFSLDCLLTAYYIRPDRYDTAMDDFWPDLTFGRKIELTKRLPLNKKLKSYGMAIAGLVAFQRLRNVVAHQWSVSLTTVGKLLDDQRLNDLLTNEGSMEETYRATENALAQLVRTKEVGVGRKIGPADPASRALLKIMSSHL